MNDEQTKETDTAGKEADKPAEGNKEDVSELNKLKEHNSEFEKELLKARELKAEADKIEAEKLLAGNSGEAVQTEPKEESSQEYKNRIEKEITQGKHDE